MFKELTCEIPGLTIAARAWGNPDAKPILALHGWLDNAASFENLAPLIHDHYIVSLDLPGHGFSSHKPLGTYLHLIDTCIDIVQIIESLGWTHFKLIGHSLGAALASLVAGALQHRVTSLILIDGLGGLITEETQCTQQFRQYLNDIKNIENKFKPTYNDFEAIITARCAVSPMTRDSARIILNRNLMQTENNTWVWRSDPRLRLASALQLTKGQTLAFLSDITAPTLLIRPVPGYPFDEKMMQWRINAIKHLVLEKIQGGHHVHLDDPKPVAELINRFFEVEDE